MKINHFIDPIEFGDKDNLFFFFQKKFLFKFKKKSLLYKKTNTTLLKFL